MSTSVVFEILLGLIATLIGFVSYLQARRANTEQVRMTTVQAEAQKAALDAGAGLRAKEIYEGALATLQDSNTRLNTQLESVNAQLESVRREAYEIRSSNNELRAEIIQLRLEIVRLQNLLPPQIGGT